MTVGPYADRDPAQLRTIERELLGYRRTHASIDDALAQSLLVEVIANLEAKRTSLHPISEIMVTE